MTCHKIVTMLKLSLRPLHLPEEIIRLERKQYEPKNII
jgi:hypothetical protein